MLLTAKISKVTGRTRHIVRGMPIKLPAAVHIVADPPGFLLLRLSADGSEVADTWHESIDAAKGQAKFEYEIEDTDWTETND